MAQRGSSVYGVRPFDGLLLPAPHENRCRQPEEEFHQVLVHGIDGKPAGRHRQECTELIQLSLATITGRTWFTLLAHEMDLCQQPVGLFTQN